ncbi:hypothetical protein BCAR13_410020 [Paraburkholderia caribensis]|nr:hypothetical protein BCAR13_410020 [Paraburkholderia caribensis]
MPADTSTRWSASDQAASVSGATSSAWPRLKRQTYRWSNRRRSEGRYQSENGHSVSSLGGESSAKADVGVPIIVRQVIGALPPFAPS